MDDDLRKRIAEITGQAKSSKKTDVDTDTDISYSDALIRAAELYERTYNTASPAIMRKERAVYRAFVHKIAERLVIDVNVVIHDASEVWKRLYIPVREHEVEEARNKNARRERLRWSSQGSSGQLAGIGKLEKIT